MHRQQLQRTLGWLFAANIALIVVSWVVSAPRVAIHFAAGGMANGWASREAAALLMAFSVSVPFALFRWGSRLLRHVPERLISVPFKTYWLSEPGLRAEMMSRMNTLMAKLGIAFMVFFLTLQVFTLVANQQNPPQLWEPGFWVVIACLLAYVALWITQLFKELSPPPGAGRE